jgi:hypothetical protein
MDGYSPFAIPGLSDALGHRDMIVPWTMLIAGLLGCSGGFGFLWWSMCVDYPMNTGGRTLFAWPYYLPITFECTVLAAAIAGLVGMCMANKLPAPYHPAFSAPGFERASTDRFFLGIEAADPHFDAIETRRFLDGLPGAVVSEIPLEY